MICNKVLIALSALMAVATAMPYFLQPGMMGEGFEQDYEANQMVWGNAPLKANPNEFRAPRPHEQNTVDDDEADTAEVANQAQDVGGDSGDATGAGQAFGGADAFANRGATFNGVAAAGAGGDSNDDADYSPDAGNAVAAAGTGQGVQQGAGAQGAAAASNNAPVYPAYNAGYDDTAAAAGGQSAHVNAIGGPPPGELQSAGNSKGQGLGLGIAVGVSLLVVATAAIAVFAIRYHRRYRF